MKQNLIMYQLMKSWLLYLHGLILGNSVISNVIKKLFASKMTTCPVWKFANLQDNTMYLHSLNYDSWYKASTYIYDTNLLIYRSIGKFIKFYIIP